MQFFEDSLQHVIELHDETYYFHASQIDKITIFKNYNKSNKILFRYFDYLGRLPVPDIPPKNNICV